MLNQPTIIKEDVMNRVVLAVMLVFGFSLPALAGDTAAIEQAAAVNVGNKLCPVSGEKVGDMGDPILFEYNGKVYNMCCAMCVKDFKKDPEKYSKIAEEEVAAAQKTGS